MSKVTTPTNTPSLLIPSGSAAPKTQLPTIRRGDRNDSVKLLQTKLGVEPLGIFGPKTEEAVKIFQKKNGLTADGVVSKNTWDKLDVLPKAETLKLATITSLARPPLPTFSLSTENLQQLQTKAQNNIANLQNQLMPGIAAKNSNLAGVALGGIGSAIGDTAKNLGKNLAGSFDGVGKDLANQGKDALKNMKDVGKNLKDAFPKQLPKVEIPKIQLPKLPKFKKKELPETKKELKKKKFKDKLAAAKAFGNQLKDTAAGYKAEADKLKKAAEKVKADVQNTVNQATQAVGNVVAGVQNTVGNVVSGITNTVTNIESNVTNAIANVPGTLTTNVMTNLSKVQEEQLKKLQESSKEALDSAKPKFDKANAAMDNAKKVMKGSSVNGGKEPTPQSQLGYTYEYRVIDKKPRVTVYKDGVRIDGASFNKNYKEEDAVQDLINRNKSSHPDIINMKKLS
jgi:peptidoglycan hydrolase-like protein with peptidoglycan-binding domain